MRHVLPKSVGCRTCHTQWSFHLKCGEDHDGYHQIHGAPKVSFDSHLSLRNLVHVGHYMLDGQCFEFLGDALPAIAHAGPGEPEDPCYAFPVAYQDAKVSGR
jgi:hypothetical protein